MASTDPSAQSPEPRPRGHSHSHSHSHSGPLELSAAEARRARLVLAAIVVPLIIATLAGLVVLWPGESSLGGSRPSAAEGSSL